MPYQVSPRKGADGSAIVVITAAPEAMSAEALLRSLKGAYPDLFRRVWYELSVPTNGAPQFEVPGGLEDDRREVRNEGSSGLSDAS